MAGYLTAAYCSLAYMQVIAPSNLSYSTSAMEVTVNTALTQSSPSYDGEAATSFSVSPALPTGISLNTTTGVISGTPTALSAQASYTVTASNAGGSTTAEVSVFVKDVAPSSLSYTASTASYTLNSAITANNPTISGGSVTSWSVSPALPEGLSLNTSTGAITGTPTAASSATNYTVTATNSGGSTTAVLSIAVSNAAPSALSYGATSFTFTNTVNITSLSPTVTGTVTSYSVSPSLPSGLSLNTSTGVISGRPLAVVSQASYTVTATGPGGSTTRALSITVNDVAPSSLSYTRQSPTYLVGEAISANSPSSSGGAVVSYSISPSLPSGLSFSTSTGVISGTPAASSAATSYTVTATNTGGSTTVSLTIGVTSQAPAIQGPESYVSGSKATLTINRAGLAATSKVQASEVFAEQSNWDKVKAVWVNTDVPVGNTNRTTGVTFRGVSDMTAVFKATADSGVYRVKNVFIVRANGERLKLSRGDLLTPEALDIEVS